mmetsp:Transcript_18498/g.38768  ORF Transcript_18498/g.38768 Transcript_18498/m.38768 type:complete len:94 (+) Transcript_18498:312-593(+)
MKFLLALVLVLALAGVFLPLWFSLHADHHGATTAAGAPVAPTFAETRPIGGGSMERAGMSAFNSAEMDKLDALSNELASAIVLNWQKYEDTTQ